MPNNILDAVAVNLQPPFRNKAQLLRTYRFLINWALDFEHSGGEDMVKHMGKCYGFGPLRRWKGGSLSDDGTLVFPGDTAKKPLLTMENSLGTVFMYKWGVVALPMKNGEHFITLMD
tara:strand:+ start:3087 stop:3437 length:351 start_codon:yes stop_codon:yes gene_type:complete